jgi:hypothetical protein
MEGAIVQSFVLAVLATVAAAVAQVGDTDVIEGLRVEPGRLRLRWENDSWLSGSDRFYTNGASIGYTLPEGPAARAITEHLAFLPWRAATTSGTATEFAVGQEMFTPEDITTTAPIPTDRPYAGWLHLDVRHQILVLDRDRRHDMMDTWLLQLGVVGPSSMADDVQFQVHEFVEAPRPAGWRNQLHDEPGLVVGFRRDFRAFHDPDWPFGLESDFEGHYEARIGNVETSARVGAQLRLGANLPRHFGSAIAGPDAGRQRIHGTVGVTGRWLVRDVFLDGNTFRHSQSVDRNDFVADFHVALHWEPCARVRLGLSQTFRTPEFDSASERGDLTQFTTLQVEVFF